MKKCFLRKLFFRNSMNEIYCLADVENFTSKPRVSRTPQSSLLAGPNEFSFIELSLEYFLFR